MSKENLPTIITKPDALKDALTQAIDATFPGSNLPTPTKDELGMKLLDEGYLPKDIEQILIPEFERWRIANTKQSTQPTQQKLFHRRFGPNTHQSRQFKNGEPLSEARSIHALWKLWNEVTSNAGLSVEETRELYRLLIIRQDQLVQNRMDLEERMNHPAGWKPPNHK